MPPVWDVEEVLETVAMAAYRCEHPFWKRPFKGTSWWSSGYNSVLSLLWAQDSIPSQGTETPKATKCSLQKRFKTPCKKKKNKPPCIFQVMVVKQKKVEFISEKYWDNHDLYWIVQVPPRTLAEAGVEPHCTKGWTPTCQTRAVRKRAGKKEAGSIKTARQLSPPQGSTREWKSQASAVDSAPWEDPA